MSSASFGHAIPCKDRASTLQHTVHQALFEGLVYLQQETKDFVNKATFEKFQDIIDILDKKKHNTALFPFTLLNQSLMESIEKDDILQLQESLNSFRLDTHKNLSSLFVFPYGDNFASKETWKKIERIFTAEFPEKSYLACPKQDLYIQTQGFIEQALQEIKQIDSNYYGEISIFVSNVLVSSSNRFIAGSSFTLLGLVGLADSHDFKMIVEYLIHETAHQYLYHLTSFDELCSGKGLHTSPLRKDPRPIEGIYHAVFVLARIIDFYQKALQTTTSLPKDFMEQQIDHYTLRYHDGYDLVLEKATLTDLGRTLLESTKNLVL